MQLSHLMGAGALIAAALVLGIERSAPPGPALPPQPPVPPQAAGHYVLVVEGDRNALDITFASHKQAPWSGVPKGFSSGWLLTVRDAAGTALAEVPLDMRPFATRADQLGKPAQVHGCIVVDSRIGMLVNVPAFATADRYEFSRTAADGSAVALSTVTGAQLADRTGGGR